jgi:hypothetical protein
MLKDQRVDADRGLAFACDVAATAVTVLAAGCSSGSPTSASSPSASAPGSAAAEVRATAVTATETEFHIALSTTTFSAGTYTFTAVNRGQLSHTLVINGPGVNNIKTSLLAPGQSGSVTVTLRRNLRHLLQRSRPQGRGHGRAYHRHLMASREPPVNLGEPASQRGGDQLPAGGPGGQLGGSRRVAGLAMARFSHAQGHLIRSKDFDCPDQSVVAGPASSGHGRGPGPAASGVVHVRC